MVVADGRNTGYVLSGLTHYIGGIQLIHGGLEWVNIQSRLLIVALLIHGITVKPYDFRLLGLSGITCYFHLLCLSMFEF